MYHCSNASKVQLRLINITKGDIWDFYLNPTTKEFTFPPELISPFRTRYCAEIRVFTEEVNQGHTLYQTAEPLGKVYWESERKS